MRLTTLFMTLAVLIAGCASKQTTKAGTEKNAATKVEHGKSDTKKAAKKDKAAVVEETKEAVAAAVGGSVVCKNGGDQRSIATHKTDVGGCEVKYTKNGETSSVANAQAGEAYCNSVAGKIKGNLEAAGFTCTEG